MKKLLLVSSIAIMCLLGISAAAEGTYTAGESSYTDSVVNNSKTVVVFKGSSISDLKDENIYYIDQSDADSGFAGFRALLKANTPAGDYIVATDSNDEAAKFTVTEGQSRISGLDGMDFLDAQKQSNDENYYSVGFTLISKDGFTENSKLVMYYNDTTYETAMFGDSGVISWGDNGTKMPNIEGFMKCAIQFDYVNPEYMTETDNAATPNFTMYFEK